jgi:hypothetical protein
VLAAAEHRPAMGAITLDELRAIAQDTRTLGEIVRND